MIDPSSDPEDPLTATTFGNGAAKMFFQSMPVTKRIDEITVGDVGLAPGCPSTTTTYLQVFRVAPGAGNYLGESARVVLPATPSKLTMAFPAATLKKGEPYSFELRTSGCNQFVLKTWPHNEPQVNPGSARCVGVPIAEGGTPTPGDTSNHSRMWHEKGQDDKQPGCVANPSGLTEYNFDKDMPTGWLTTYTPNGSLYTVAGTSRPDGTTGTPACQSGRMQAAGATEVYHRESGAGPDDRVVCKWPMFAPLGSEVPHGWYYALPFRGEASPDKPRDLYLKLDTIDYSAELAEHLPIFRLDSDEGYRPLSPGALTDFYEGDSPTYEGYSNLVADSSGPFAIADSSYSYPLDPSSPFGHLSLDYLQPTYPSSDGSPIRRSGAPAEPGDFVSARGNDADGLYQGDARIMGALPRYADRVYARAAHGGDGRLWLQYWVFYYFNAKTYFGAGVHEGDWEMVQFRLNDAGQIDKAAYSQHDGGETCPTDKVDFDGGRPQVYVGLDSHASYFRPKDDVVDRANGEVEIRSLTLENLESTTPWNAWPGSWGDSGISPPSPLHQNPKWLDPSDWVDDPPSGVYPCQAP